MQRALDPGALSLRNLLYYAAYDGLHTVAQVYLAKKLENLACDVLNRAVVRNGRRAAQRVTLGLVVASLTVAVSAVFALDLAVSLWPRWTTKR